MAARPELSPALDTLRQRGHVVLRTPRIAHDGLFTFVFIIFGFHYDEGFRDYEMDAQR